MDAPQCWQLLHADREGGSLAERPRARTLGAGGEGGKFLPLRSSESAGGGCMEAGLTVLGSTGSEGRQSRECRSQGGSSEASWVWEEEREPAKGSSPLRAEAE